MLVVFLLAGDVFGKDVSSASDRLNKIAEEIQGLREKDRGLDKGFRRAEGKLKKSDKALSKVNSDARKITLQIKKKSKNLEKLRASVAKRGEEIRLLRERLRSNLFALQKLGPASSARRILSPEDVTAAQRYTYWFAYLTELKTKQMENLRQSEIDLQGLEKEQTKTLSDLTQLNGEKKRQVVALTSARNKNKVLAKRLGKSRDKGKAELKKLRADSVRLATLLERLRFAETYPEFAVDEKTPFHKLKGKLSWPLQGEVKESEFSKGVTIFAPPGSKVRAVSHGRVVFADWMRGFGLLTIIDHGGGYMSLYGQNESLYMKNGDWVEPGTVISASGQSGGAGASGVYFEIRKNAESLDPKKWSRLRH